MKSVILICLLSLSVCYSVAAPSEVAPPALAAQTVQPKANETDAKPKVPEKVIPATGTQLNTNATVTNGATATNSTTVNTNVAPQTNETKNGAAPAEKDNKTDTKPDKEVPKTNDKPAEVAPAKNDTKPVPPEHKGKNDTSTDSKDSKTVVPAPKNEVVTPSETPKVQASRAFDGPSFIGGIILTLGLLAIGFMGFKYYKNQTERNYHTL